MDARVHDKLDLGPKNAMLCSKEMLAMEAKKYMAKCGFSNTFTTKHVSHGQLTCTSKNLSCVTVKHANRPHAMIKTHCSFTNIDECLGLVQ